MPLSWGCANSMVIPPELLLELLLDPPLELLLDPPLELLPDPPPDPPPEPLPDPLLEPLLELLLDPPLELLLEVPPDPPEEPEPPDEVDKPLAVPFGVELAPLAPPQPATTAAKIRTARHWTRFSQRLSLPMSCTLDAEYPCIARVINTQRCEQR